MTGSGLGPAETFLQAQVYGNIMCPEVHSLNAVILLFIYVLNITEKDKHRLLFVSQKLYTDTLNIHLIHIQIELVIFTLAYKININLEL